MFIAIVGTRCSGKDSVQKYLIDKGFTPLSLSGSDDSLSRLHHQRNSSCESTVSTVSTVSAGDDRGFFSLAPPEGPDTDRATPAYELAAAARLSFLNLSPLSSPVPPSVKARQRLRFSTPADMLAHITRHWTEHFVTMDLGTRALLAPFMRRPFFMLISVDAPILLRYRRARTKTPGLALLDFVQEHDQMVHGYPESDPEDSPVETLVPQFNHSASQSTLDSPHISQAAADSLHAIRDLVHLHIDNAFDAVSDLHFHLEKLDLLDPSHLRPEWDAYFMTIASLASHRSNCMKRRVGAVLVDARGGNRILATGYNGTPRGLTNCNAGGCPRCNTGIESVECICLHAEENALLEAGRERVGHGAVLYCNTCPCLKCTVKIIQTGVSTVVYNLSYKVDDASASLFKESGVELRRYNPNHKHYLPTIDAPGLRMTNP